MINFGSPRVGTEGFKEWTEKQLINLSTWRFVNKNDIVARLPLSSYKHSGHLFMIWRFKSEAYYRQTGDKEMGLASTQRSWNRKWKNPFFQNNTRQIYNLLISFFTHAM